MQRRSCAAVVVLSCLACGGKSTVAARAHIVSGPAAPSSFAPRPPAGAPHAAPAAGHWFISPDEGTVTLLSLTFRSADGSKESVALAGCSPSYSRRSSSLSTLLDCPFQVPSGTYVGVDIEVAATAQVLINDAVHGIYTDPSSPTGLSTTPPAAGAQLAALTVPASNNGGKSNTIESALATPFVVGNGQADGGSEAIELTIIEDMIHTVFVDVTGSTAKFDTTLPQPPVSLLPSVTGPGRVEYYAPSGTAQNVNVGPATGNEAGSVRLFYAPPPQPAFVWHVVPGPSASYAANPAKFSGSGFKPGGYLGLDSTGTACWALAGDDSFTWATYSQLCQMKVAANVGETTSVKCQHMGSVPAPSSGDTYASGCPAITPDGTQTVTLVAR
jgi:hypothetical protein